MKPAPRGRRGRLPKWRLLKELKTHKFMWDKMLPILGFLGMVVAPLEGRRGTEAVKKRGYEA